MCIPCSNSVFHHPVGVPSGVLASHTWRLLLYPWETPCIASHSHSQQHSLASTVCISMHRKITLPPWENASLSVVRGDHYSDWTLVCDMGLLILASADLVLHSLTNFDYLV